jgi:FkbM family methyltransferase
MSILDSLIDALVENQQLHIPTSAGYGLCKAVARQEIEPLFESAERIERNFGPFNALSMPFTKMGAIDSLDLFGLDELIIFAFYHANRARYRQVLDIGANLGLHSLIMSKCGFKVVAFEPDPWHYEKLTANLAGNQASSVESHRAAVSTTDGEAQFVRVLGNTTGSHLAGAKESYGDREYLTVPVRAAQPLLANADFAKIDAEGHEKNILLAVTPEIMSRLDIMVEIGSEANAAAIFEHFDRLKVGMFPQKIGWSRARKVGDLPTSHRDGSLFISVKAAMPW